MSSLRLLRSSSSSLSSSRACGVSGPYKTSLDCSSLDGQVQFQLVTHQVNHSTLRHFFLGLRQLEREHGKADLVRVNRIDVRGFSHVQVVSVLNDHLARITEDELTLTLRAKDSRGRKHFVEVSIAILDEDGFGDAIRHGLDVIIRVKDKIVTTPDVTDVQFRYSSCVRIGHGAQTGHFLQEEADHKLCMTIPTSHCPQDVFKCYVFIGDNQGGGGGGVDTFPTLCVLQHLNSCRFVVACPSSGCLKTDEDQSFHTNIESITTPDCHFFIRHTSGNGDNTYCLQPLVLPHYYLRYDSVDGLKLRKCKKPPYKDFAALRFFSFLFVPVNDTSSCVSSSFCRNNLPSRDGLLVH